MKKKDMFVLLTILLVVIGFNVVYFMGVLKDDKKEINNAGVLRLDINEDKFKELKGDGVVVLNYHTINKSKNLYDIGKDDFTKHIKTMLDKKVNFITPDDLNDFLSKKKKLPKKSVLITFDDVDESLYYEGYPLLKENKIKFTIFMVMNHIGDKNFKELALLDVKQIKDMKSSKLMTIGTHTYDMHSEDKVGKPVFIDIQNAGKFKNDVMQSGIKYKSLFGEMPKYFAYPYGFGIPKTDEILLENKYKMIFSLEYGVVKQNDPEFFVKRILATNENLEKMYNWYSE